MECARVAVRKDPHLGEFYARLKHRRGERKALIAVARKLVLRLLDAQEEHNLRGAVSLEVNVGRQSSGL